MELPVKHLIEAAIQIADLSGGTPLLVKPDPPPTPARAPAPAPPNSGRAAWRPPSLAFLGNSILGPGGSKEAPEGLAGGGPAARIGDGPAAQERVVAGESAKSDLVLTASVPDWVRRRARSPSQPGAAAAGGGRRPLLPQVDEGAGPLAGRDRPALDSRGATR